MNKKTKKENQKTAVISDFPLSQLYFYLTEGCNLACRHCWLAPKFDPDGSKSSMLPLGIFQKAIEEAIPLGLQTVKLTGGEPLLHPDFNAMLDFISKKGLGLTLETNGILLSPKIAGAIAKQNNPFVSVSLDGADAKTHDRIRGVDGAFNKAISAVQSQVEYGTKTQIIMSIMQSNADQLEAMIELAESLDADSVKFNIIQPTGRGETFFDGVKGLEVEKLIELGRWVETELAMQTDMELYFDHPAAFRSLRRIASGDGCSSCGILSILGVLPGGEYALCGIGSHVKELVFGKAGNGLLAKIWHEHSVLNRLRTGLPDKLTGICGHCLMKHICLGSCIAQNYYRNKSLWAPFWFCEQAGAEGLFPESRLDLSFNNS